MLILANRPTSRNEASRSDTSRNDASSSYSRYEHPPPPAGPRPLETRPSESRPLDSRPSESRPLESRPFELRPSESRPYDSRPYESRPMDSRPSESRFDEKRSYEPMRGRRNYPPRPTVEDEEASLKREHGSTISSTYEDVPPSRGLPDQNPVIMDVFEYNPERRFVIVSGSPNDSGDSDSDTQSSKKPPYREREPAPYASSASKTSRQQDAHLKTDSGYGTDGGKPNLERRRSRQDLPRIDTELKADRVPEHHRTKSTGQAPSQPKPEFYSAREPRPYGGSSSAAPEVIKHGSSGREKTYREYGQSRDAERKTATSKLQSEDRRTNDSPIRGSSTPSTSKRSDGRLESDTKRPYSNDRIGGPRTYVEQPTPRSSTRRDKSPPYRRSDRDEPSRSSKYPPTRDPRDTRESTTHHEDSRSGDDYSKRPREPIPPPKKSVVVQEPRESAPRLEKEDVSSGSRLKSRGPSLPIPVPIPVSVPSFTDSAPPQPRTASTFPVASRDTQRQAERPKSQLPYPDDDDGLDPLTNLYDPRNTRDWTGTGQYEYQQPVVMPEMPIPIAIGPETPLETRMATIPSSHQVQATSQSWQPPTFDPERDGVHLDRPVGTYRRYSEKAESSVVPNFPDCRRKHPVAGMMDWLTLPRTDFNICPECYGAVFGHTAYRTLFQPLLRPSNTPISCDFGVYPWYRIAWLLTLKNDTPDLRLFHQIANAMSATGDQPCPRDRATVRDWLTVRNPYTQRGVYDFAVCYQCAGVIEALLPNLTGLFVPLDIRPEHARRTCSMRFSAKRRRFVMYFDAMETTSDRAQLEQREPDLQNLADELEKMTVVSECQEDKPITNGSWHTMQFLPDFTVCGECFEDVIYPKLDDDNVIARNFYMKPQRLPVATCQLYSPRMRDIFSKACRWNDPKYLESKVMERMQVEADIHDKLKRLTKSKEPEEWVDEQVDKLIREWKNWE